MLSALLEELAYNSPEDLEDSPYKLLQKTMCSVSVDMRKIITEEGDVTSLSSLAEILSDGIDSLGKLLSGLSALLKLSLRDTIKDTVGAKVGDLLSGGAAAMTTDQNVSEDRELHIRNKLIYCAEDQKAAGIYAWYKDKLPISLRTTYLNLKSGVNSVWYEENNDGQTVSKLFIWDSISGMKPLYGSSI